MNHLTERRTPRLATHFAGIVILPILLCSAAIKPSTPSLDELAPAGMQFTMVQVGRIDDIVTLPALDADSPLKTVSGEVSDYCEDNPGTVDVEGLTAHLELTHETAEEGPGDGYKYHYKIGPDGPVHRFCIRRIEIRVFDAGEPEPVVVTAIEEMSI